ncbi:permeability factor 2-like [Scomber scombrus]|uniref:Permeability factor 2-like n=1 Tax=Scomber scombrus TaxID=13677 RepID=A0AAV1Q6Z5_SCOSC|nr:permeability factor 2-like [Scomber scombrus]
MNTKVQCIILLICITICTSAVIRTNCRCVRTIRGVDPLRINGLKIYDPRPYCNKQEIIVMLKDGPPQCLDPTGKFAQALVETTQRKMKQRAVKMNTSTTKAAVI